MELLHYSAEPITALHSILDQPAGLKPAGFWVSVGDDWSKWCQRENYLLNQSYVYRVGLKEWKRILWIKSVDELDTFAEQHTVWNHRFGDNVNWSAVADRYAGIIIAPYRRERRRNLFWYYAWDCASGCIWDASVISKLTLDQERSILS